MRASFISGSALALALLVTSSCGSSGDLVNDLGAALGDYVVVDLATGTATTRVDIADLVSNPTYRDRYLVFKAIPTASGSIGSVPGAFGAQVDEPVTAVANGRFFLGVFEVTQAQWARLAVAASLSPDPWSAFSASVIGDVDGDKAAMGLNFDDITAMLATSGGSGFGYRLPTSTEWELACRAGTTATFAWGEARDDTTVSQHAVVAETAIGINGPRTVGGRTPNAFGFYDMHGNVWEMTSTGDIRGGSWRDSLPNARSANHVAIDPATYHPLVGLRLVLEFR